MIAFISISPSIIDSDSAFIKKDITSDISHAITNSVDKYVSKIAKSTSSLAIDSLSMIYSTKSKRLSKSTNNLIIDQFSSEIAFIQNSSHQEIIPDYNELPYGDIHYLASKYTRDKDPPRNKGSNLL